MPDPIIPEITDEEAAALATFSLGRSVFGAVVDHLQESKMMVGGFSSALGRAALAKHIAERERDVRRKAIEECCASAERWDNDVGFAEGPADWIRREVQP